MIDWPSAVIDAIFQHAHDPRAEPGMITRSALERLFSSNQVEIEECEYDEACKAVRVSLTISTHRWRMNLWS